MITIRYFGLLRELLQCHEETLAWSGQDSHELLQQLRARGDDWANALSEQNVFRIVLNHQVIEEPTAIPDGSEVAFLPPVTGG
ncbi:MAG: MoaD/ThiS family protein [Neisseriales bacterium]|nr:MAG: MoaD/ThiS family protein [Neisseriales bacterium]